LNFITKTRFLVCNQETFYDTWKGEKFFKISWVFLKIDKAVLASAITSSKHFVFEEGEKRLDHKTSVSNLKPSTLTFYDSP